MKKEKKEHYIKKNNQNNIWMNCINSLPWWINIKKKLKIKEIRKNKNKMKMMNKMNKYQIWKNQINQRMVPWIATLYLHIILIIIVVNNPKEKVQKVVQILTKKVRRFCQVILTDQLLNPKMSMPRMMRIILMNLIEFNCVLCILI